MPSSYSIPSVYSPQEPIYSNETYSNHSTAPATITGAIMGAGLGGYIGYRKNPYVNKAGEATDSFTKAVYERYINKANHLGKNSYNGGMNILKKFLF